MKSLLNVISDLERVIQKHPLWLAILVNAFLFILVYSVYSPRFMTNDDVGMMLEVAGVSRTATSSPYLIHSHYFLGVILKFLYSFGHSTPWYGIYLLSMVVFSHITFLYISLKSNPRLWTLMVYLFYFALIGVELLINLQFTISSTLIGFAGMSLLIFLGDELSSEKNEKSSLSIKKSHFLFTLIFLALSVMIRWKAFLMVVIIAVPIFVVSLLGKSRLIIRSKISVLCIVLALCFGLNIVNRIVWTTNEDWSEFYHFNKLRSKLSGNNPLDYLEEDELANVLESVDWSRNDYYMFKTFYFLDQDVFNAEKLKVLLDATPTFKEISFSKSFKWLMHICSNNLVQCAFLVFMLGCILAFRDRRKLLILVAAIFAFPVVIFFLIYYFRPPPSRVYFNMAAFISLIPIMISYGSSNGLFSGLNVKGAVRLGVTAVAVILLFSKVSIRVDSYSEQSERTVYNSNSIHSLTDFVEYKYPSDLFVTWGSSFFWEYVTPFERLDYLEKFYAFHVGCSQLTPSNLELLDSFQVSDLMTDIVERDDIFLIYNGSRKERLFRTYLKEHRNISSELIEVYGTKKFKISEVRPIN